MNPCVVKCNLLSTEGSDRNVWESFRLPHGTQTSSAPVADRAHKDPQDRRSGHKKESGMWSWKRRFIRDLVLNDLDRQGAQFNLKTIPLKPIHYSTDKHILQDIRYTHLRYNNVHQEPNPASSSTAWHSSLYVLRVQNFKTSNFATSRGSESCERC